MGVKVFQERRTRCSLLTSVFISMAILGWICRADAMGPVIGANRFQNNSADSNFRQDVKAWRTPPSIENVAAWEDPAYGYRVIVIVDKSERGTSPTAQTANIFTFDETTRQWSQWNKEEWKVSTGRESGGRGHGSSHTQTGFFRAEDLNPRYVARSREVMPYSIFYDQRWGTALHQTTESRYKTLGQRASAGCTRLTGQNARRLYELVQSYGKQPVVELVPNTGLPNFIEEVVTEVHYPNGTWEEKVLNTFTRNSPRVIESWRALIINTYPGGRENASDLKMDPRNVISNPQILSQQLFRGWRPQI